MIDRFLRRNARLGLLALVPALAVAACSGDDDLLPPTSADVHLEVIVNSTSNSLTIVSADSVSPTPRTVSLGAQGSPVSVAARGAFAVVPLGTYPFAAVVDLRTATVAHTVALPAGSGATGAAFLNDSIALVGNPELNSVTPVNVLRGTAGPAIPVGVYPQALVAGSNVVYVLNANLVNFSPAGPSTVSVIGQARTVTATATLSGTNAAAGQVVGNTLVVVNAGHFGQTDGSLSLVSTNTNQEFVHATGFGEFPGSVAFGPDGLLYVALYSKGIVTWNPNTGDFVRGPSSPLVPGGAPPVSAVAFDYIGRMHTLAPGNCAPGNPGKEYGLALPFASVSRTVTTGVCPFALAFATLPVAVN
jgi:hypothetical protein